MTFCFKSFIAILLASQITGTLAAAPTFDLTQSVQEIKKQLPSELAEGILLTDVEYNLKKQTLIYSATALDTEPEQINQEHIINKVCYTPQLRNAIKQDVTVSFFFYDEKRNPLKHVVVTEALCQTNFKEFESTLIDSLKKTNPTLLPTEINKHLTLFNLTYQPAKKAMIVDIKVTNDRDKPELSQKESIKIACTDEYLSLFVERDVGYIFNYYNSKGSELLSTFNISPKDCRPQQTIEITNPLDKRLMEEAQSMKKNLAALSTPQIELIDVGYDINKRIIWNQAVIKDPSITKDKINPMTTIAALCSKSATRQTINQGVAYYYRYYNSHHEPMIDLLVDLQACKAYDKNNNILLQPK